MPAVYRDNIRIEPVGFPEVTENLMKIVPDLQGVIRDTIKRSVPFAETQVVEQIVKRYHISESSLKDQASRHGRWKFKPKYPSGSDLTGGIEVTGTRMPVMRFSVSPSAVPNQRGVPVLARPAITIRIVKRGRAQVGKPNVFLARMPKTGHTGVFKRKYPNPGGPRKKRADGQWSQLPITEEYMLSVPEMLAAKKLRKKFDEIFSKHVLSVFTEELNKLSRKSLNRMSRALEGLI